MTDLAAFFNRAGPIGALILVSSVIALFIVVERLLTFRRIRLRDPEYIHRIRSLAAEGDFAGAEDAARSQETHPLALSLAHVLSRAGAQAHRSRVDLEKAVAHEATRQVRRLERFLPTLHLISNVSPLLGLLGTVTGMIKAFQAIQNLGGKVNASVLAGGIWEAMLTTALGLGVAIPALIAHNIFQGKIQNLVADLKEEATELFDLLEDRGALVSGSAGSETRGTITGRSTERATGGG